MRPADEGLKKEPDLWMPKTWGEWFDSLARIWKFLFEKLDQLPDVERAEAVRILLDRSRGLTRIKSLSPMVLDTIESLAEKPYVLKKDLLDAVFTVLRFERENLSAESLSRWENMKQELTGRDYPSKMKRYAGIAFMHDMTTDGDPLDPVKPKIAELAKESVLHRNLLAKELSWLTTNKAENGYMFGYDLAENDQGYTLLCMLLDAQRQAGADGSAFFLGGYFRHLAEKDPRRYEEELDRLANDPILKKWVPEITWRAKTTDRAAQRLIDLVKRGEVDRNSLRMFAYAGAVRNLDEKIFTEWIEFLLQQEGDFDSIALAANLAHFYYRDGYSERELPEELIKRILMNDVFFGIIGQKTAKEVMDSPAFGNTMIEYYWVELGKAYVEKYPDKSLDLGYKMLEHFGDDWTIVSMYSEGVKVLTQIARIHTLKIWEQASKFLGPPIDRRAYTIQQWLRGDRFRGMEKGFLGDIPMQEIFEWVDEDVEERAWYLAYFVPKKPFSIEGRICPREVLVRYGNREDVRSNLRANFETEFFSGSESLHDREKKNYLLSLKQHETNANVRLWLDEYIEILDQSIKRAENREERLDF